MKYTAKRTIQVWICVSYVCLFLSSSAVTGQCNDPLGIADVKLISKNQFSASSNPLNAHNARLGGKSAWIATEAYDGNVDIIRSPERGPWIEVDFEEPINVTGIATQGFEFQREEEEYVKLYQVAYKERTGGSTRWRSIRTRIDGGDLTKVFLGTENDDDFDTPVRRNFPQQQLRFIRIYPTDCQVRCSLRFELYGCRPEVSTTTPPTTTTHPPAAITPRPQKTTTMATARHITTATTAQRTTPTSNPAATSMKKAAAMPTITQPTGMSASDFITFSSSSSTTPFEDDVGAGDSPSESLVLSTGSITGIVIGAFALVMLAAVCLFLIMRRNKRRPEDKEETRRDEARYDVNNDVIIAPVNTQPPVYATIEADDTSNENALNKDNEYAYAYTPQQGDGLSSSKRGTNSSMTVAKDAQTSSDCAYAYAEPYGKDVPQHDQGEYAYAYTEGNTSSPTVGGQYSSPQEGWEENSIYASGNNDDNGQGHDMTATEGWADNTIYASDGDHYKHDAIGNNNRGRVEEGWENNIIYADSGDN